MLVYLWCFFRFLLKVVVEFFVFVYKLISDKMKKNIDSIEKFKKIYF